MRRALEMWIFSKTVCLPGGEEKKRAGVQVYGCRRYAKGDGYETWAQRGAGRFALPFDFCSYPADGKLRKGGRRIGKES